MSTRKKAESQLDVIDRLLPTTKTVTVKGKAITLTVPTEAAVRTLRKVQFALAPKDGAEPDMAALADASLTLAAGAVRACIEGLDESRALRLVLASGGEMGTLSRTAMDLCGLGAATQRALAAGEADDPT